MVKPRSRVPLTSVFHKTSKNTSDENGVPVQIAVKAVEKVKRSAENSPENAPSRKRSAFGDITNAALVHQGGKDIKKKQAKSVVRKESQRQSKAKEAAKANPKQRRSKEKNECSAEKRVVVEDSPSGEILSSQDLIEESSASSQDSLQSSSSITSLDVTIPQSSPDSVISSLKASSSSHSDKNAKDDSKQEQDEEVESAVDDGVIDIDADISDPVTVSEYAYEIFVNMKRREELFPLTNYMETQTDITPQMRAILVDWLVEVQECFELYHETLYLGVKLLDHYLERNSIKKDELQLIGATTLIISSKIEERHPPCMDDFIYICDDAYQQHRFIAMEGKIIRSLGFDINIPIPYRFLRRYAKAAFASIQTLTLARFLLESSLLESRFIANKASYMAASCLYLALLMNNCSEWTPTLVHYTGYTKDELRECVLQLNSMHATPPNKNLTTVRSKYLHTVFHEVAKIPAVDTLTIQI